MALSQQTPGASQVLWELPSRAAEDAAAPSASSSQSEEEDLIPSGQLGTGFCHPRSCPAGEGASSGRGVPALLPPRGSCSRAWRWALRAPCLVGFLLDLVDRNTQTKM